MESKKTFYKVLNGFFSFCNSAILFAVKYPVLILCLFVTIIFAVLILLINNNINVGGIIGKLLGMFGVGNNKNNIELANTTIADRQEKIGEADARGYAQHKVSELESSLNPFRDKTTITLPDGKRVQLPSGVKDTDVETVILSRVDVKIIPTADAQRRLIGTQKVIKEAEDTNAKAKDLLIRLKERQK